MQMITSIPSAAVPQGELGRILADYLTLDQVRSFRRLLVVRFGALALAALLIGAALPGFSESARGVPVALIVLVPVTVWIIELRMQRRLSRALRGVDGGITRRVHVEQGLRVGRPVI